MFFIISKLLSFLVAPAFWFFALLVLSFFAKNAKLKKRSFIISMLVLFVFSNGVLYNEARRLYEPREKLISELKEQYDYGVVLTGMTYVNEETGTAHFSQGGDRIMQAVRLYAEGKIKKIFITGGSSKIVPSEYREANFLREFLLNLGLPEEDVIAEPEARNTWENALFTANWLANKPYENIIIITSGIHMPRSIACYKKVGLSFDTFPTDPYRSRSDYRITSFLIPNPKIMSDWGSIFHEWIGFVAYKIAGYA